MLFIPTLLFHAMESSPPNSAAWADSCARRRQAHRRPPIPHQAKRKDSPDNLGDLFAQRSLSALDCEESSSDRWHVNCYFGSVFCVGIGAHAGRKNGFPPGTLL